MLLYKKLLLMTLGTTLVYVSVLSLTFRKEHKNDYEFRCNLKLICVRQQKIIAIIC